ncbi:homeobox protein Hox-D9-like [Schistocerca gregaria]|uniref:homeobox protein Hox-D9-like n=1 Tax=Schistocerca gregaria TaxID=7010 RepID=UPI00211ED83D|nr:homeobox protein Hox-D9-like [Schistocerca gregaria]
MRPATSALRVRTRRDRSNPTSAKAAAGGRRGGGRGRGWGFVLAAACRVLRRSVPWPAGAAAGGGVGSGGGDGSAGRRVVGEGGGPPAPRRAAVLPRPHRRPDPRRARSSPQHNRSFSAPGCARAARRVCVGDGGSAFRSGAAAWRVASVRAFTHTAAGRPTARHSTQYFPTTCALGGASAASTLPPGCRRLRAGPVFTQLLSSTPY